MKIAYFSPFSPDRSGISDFSEELVMELSKYCQMDLYAAKPIANEEICSKFPVFQITEINDSNKRKQYDHLIYQAGNNRNYHKAVIDTFLKYPGILELHDLSLHYYLAEDTYVQKDFDKYIEIMKYCHGKKGEPPNSCKYNQRKYRCYHTSIDCQAASPQIEYLKQIILITVPLKNHVIKPCSYNRKNNTIKRKIQINLRILPPSFRI